MLNPRVGLLFRACARASKDSLTKSFASYTRAPARDIIDATVEWKSASRRGDLWNNDAWTMRVPAIPMWW